MRKKKKPFFAIGNRGRVLWISEKILQSSYFRGMNDNRFGATFDLQKRITLHLTDILGALGVLWIGVFGYKRKIFTRIYYI